MADYDIGAAFAAIEDELISSMVRNLSRHRAEETAEGIQWPQWQAQQLEALEEYRRKNQKAFKGRFSSINRKLKTAIRAAYTDGSTAQEREILDAVAQGFSARQQTDSLGAGFFTTNRRKLDALVDATTKDMKRAETAVLRRANDQYRKIIFNAQVYANTGAGTYEKAVDMTTKDFLAAGLQCVVYANGSRHTLSDYADMALRTASKRAYLAGEGTKRQEWGVATVILNKRSNACPKCAKFCGKVFIDDVWSGGTASSGDYPLLSSAIRQGLYHPRCKDSHTTYFPGLTEEPAPWTGEELRKLGKTEEARQKQQYARRQAEKYRRLERFSLDGENQRKYKARAQGWRRQFMRNQDSRATTEFEAAGQEFRSAATKREAEAFAKTYTESGEFRVDGDFKMEIVNGFNEAAHNVSSRFGRKLKIKGIQRVKAGDGKYQQASYNPSTQMVALKNSSMKTLQENAEKNFASGWNASKDRYGTYYHEIGHAVWYDLPTEARSEIRALYQETKHSAYEKWMSMGGSRSGKSQAEIFGQQLSRYAMEDEQEFFSEAFSQIMSGRMRPVSRQTNTILNKYYNQNSVAKPTISGIIGGESSPELDFGHKLFAEKDIYNQESVSLKRSIRKFKKRIEEHEGYIRNPKLHCPDWDEKLPREQEGLKRHWQKEIRNFNDSIQVRVEELKKRGDYDD